ncbi:MAG: serine/threonine-protein kinase [Pirellulaceae bacterium]
MIHSVCLHETLLHAYWSGEVYDENDQITVDRHLEYCESCVEKLNHIREKDAQFREQDMVETASVADTLTIPSVDREPNIPQAMPIEIRESSSWQWLGRLGGGGGGDVFLARNRVLGTLFAVKIVGLPNLQSRDSWKRSAREAIGCRIPPHVNFLRIEPPTLVGSHLLFPMQYVFGQDLEQLARSNGGTLSITWACHLVLQSLIGMAHAERYGIVHRDLKPANLAVGQDGVVKILDFGLAKQIECDTTLTQTGLTGVGTPQYLAPEQALGFRQGDTQSDQYSLGCTLYRLLVGHAPFDAPGDELSPDQIIQAKLKTTPPEVHTLNPAIPRELSKVIARMLHRKPAMRYPSMQDAARALAPFVTLDEIPDCPPWVLSAIIFRTIRF